MRSYGQYCPVARAAEVLGDRWTVLIVRELTFGVDRFNELQRCLPGISRSVLAERLRHLERLGLIERTEHLTAPHVTYSLTPAGQDLRPVLRSLGEWAARWAFGDPDPRELDPDLLMRWISRHVAAADLPARRVVLEFQVTARRPRRYWLLLESAEVSLCLRDPGFDTDVTVTAEVGALYDVYLGRRTLRAVMRDDLVTLTGPLPLVRAFPQWFTWSDFAPTIAAAGRAVGRGA
ncbi:winged helix-turn-helix transcriptional regulator [Georgenia yuyongxinii]|uniref:Helix-turn-helix transcriptional regulator n=1 Tax=Georgenia yuyongxinii TaxID=2589797 RepID=A0A552WSD4_9MICO|nr:helix-turn-helix domain-containing protein [Georgenia yuyongxinii]TRW45740.1 helix-turn-helix transcriptional regulator [Georgenia yuyongxinii]